MLHLPHASADIQQQHQVERFVFTAEVFDPLRPPLVVGDEIVRREIRDHSSEAALVDLRIQPYQRNLRAENRGVHVRGDRGQYGAGRNQGETERDRRTAEHSKSVARQVSSDNRRLAGDRARKDTPKSRAPLGDSGPCRPFRFQAGLFFRQPEPAETGLPQLVQIHRRFVGVIRPHQFIPGHRFDRVSGCTPQNRCESDSAPVAAWL